MIARTWALAGRLTDSYLALADESLSLARALLLESQRGRRLVLAVNLLKGNPTAYRLDFRDGSPVFSSGPVMLAECTVTNTPPGEVTPVRSVPI